ncbi:hypothetical protein GCM10011369_31100 [Neiella marina]|uniref:Uncharacterized protein n=1 Tax=Neiella marina TaxID=508461 RepID=A0A8J2U8R4_9GAMM|nr:hypothetical protein GCM10011369_31100 [Neiella marina]
MQETSYKLDLPTTLIKRKSKQRFAPMSLFTGFPKVVGGLFTKWQQIASAQLNKTVEKIAKSLF